MKYCDTLNRYVLSSNVPEIIPFLVFIAGSPVALCFAFCLHKV